ncbi:MAG: DUF1330 domain-containing protein [Gemmobacter sp.]|jgi:uncharacterized protein (DUF1330 family)|nr:DUF1330 domain-containing protein [Gemmobacter sp.]
MKGYWLIMGSALIDEAAQAEYGRLWAPIAARYGARLIRGDQAPELVERLGSTRVVLVEFADMATAKACYHDPDYAAAMVWANKAAQRELLFVEGVITERT